MGIFEYMDAVVAEFFAAADNFIKTEKDKGGRTMRMLLTDTQMDRLEARFGANYQAPDRKLNADDIAIAFALGLSLAAMLIL